MASFVSTCVLLLQHLSYNGTDVIVPIVVYARKAWELVWLFLDEAKNLQVQMKRVN
jgi:hypothetical protein